MVRGVIGGGARQRCHRVGVKGRRQVSGVGWSGVS